MSNIRKIICVLALVCGDIAALLLAFLAAFELRSAVLPRLIRISSPPLPFSLQMATYFSLEILILIAILVFEKLYTKRYSFWEETRRLLKAVSLSFIILLIIVFITRSYTEFSRIVLILTFLFGLVLLPTVRLWTKRLLASTYIWKKKVFILGSCQAAEHIIESLRKNPTLGYEIIGVLLDRDEPSLQEAPNSSGVRVLGFIDEVEELSRTWGAQDIIVALPSLENKRLIELVERCEKMTETIRIIPEMGSLFTMGVETENLGDVLSLSVARNLAKPWNIAFKRLFEVGVAVFIVGLFSPVFLIIAAAIKLSSPGSAFFRQERIGQHGRTFHIIKFRSMHVDGDEKISEYLKHNSEARRDWETYQKIKNNDPRVTRIGRLIRKYSLDEIPQILNVIRGEMSLVGPRPYLPREKELMGEAFNIISKVKPAMTGLWQVSGRNVIPFRERIVMDEYYIRNWSFWLDIVILLRTVRVLVKREGAY